MSNAKKRFLSIFKPLGGSRPEEDVVKNQSPTPKDNEKKMQTATSFRSPSPVQKQMSTRMSSNNQYPKVETKPEETKTERPETPTKTPDTPTKKLDTPTDVVPVKPEIKLPETTDEKVGKVDNIEVKVDNVEVKVDPEVKPVEQAPQPIKPAVVKKKKKNDDFDWLDFLEQEKKEDVYKKEPLKPEEARKIISETLKTHSFRKKFKLFFTKNPGLRDARIRKNLLKEILETEQDYVKSLKVIIDGFLNPLRKSKILKEQQLSSIFLTVETIAKLQEDFLRNIKNELDAPFPYQPKMGRVFSQWAPQLEKNYSEFISGFDEADKTLQKLLDTNAAFKKQIEKLQQNPDCCSLPLQGILIKPVQRLPRYGLLLRDLINRTPSDHIDADGIKEALKAIEKVTSIANEQKREMENSKILSEVEKRISSKPKLVQLMKDPKRKLKYHSSFKLLIKQMKFDKVELEIPQEPYELYLYTDLCLLVKKRNEGDSSDVVYYIIYYLFSSIVFEDKANLFYFKTKQKSKDCEFHLTPENPSVDLLQNWNGYFVKEMNLLKSNNKVKEMADKKNDSDSQIRNLLEKKEIQDQKKKAIDQEYIPLKSQLREDEIHLQILYEKIKNLEKKVQIGKEKTQSFESEIDKIEKETKGLALEYQTLKKKDDQIEEEIFNYIDEKTTYKKVFGDFPNVGDTGFDMRFNDWEITKNRLFLTDPPKDDPFTGFFWHDVHLENIFTN